MFRKIMRIQLTPEYLKYNPEEDESVSAHVDIIIIVIMRIIVRCQ